ncbi:MAG: hypothetical protein H7122_00565 [Chitinophagaceae bacterium]|nr:hypothetical protein [Chitinophagaceae bacterium]
MSTILTKPTFEALNMQLQQKRNQYDEMILQNKEFEEVKQLFIEIRALEQSLVALLDGNSSSALV